MIPANFVQVAPSSGWGWEEAKGVPTLGHTQKVPLSRFGPLQFPTSVSYLFIFSFLSLFLFSFLSLFSSTFSFFLPVASFSPSYRLENRQGLPQLPSSVDPCNVQVQQLHGVEVATGDPLPNMLPYTHDGCHSALSSVTKTCSTYLQHATSLERDHYRHATSH